MAEQALWPGGGKQIFCLREGEGGEAEGFDPSEFPVVERVAITRLERYGKQLSVILDRPTRKRCNFLFLEKRYKSKPGTYEQIFFRTQSGMQQHRSASRVNLHAHAARVLSELHVLHPGVQIIYAGSRKAAEQWCAAWFSARAKDLWHRRQDEPAGRAVGGSGSVEEPGGQAVGEPPALSGDAPLSSPADTAEMLRRVVLSDPDLPRPFSIRDLRAAFPGVPDARIRSVLQTFKREGQIESVGAGPAARWRRV